MWNVLDFLHQLRLHRACNRCEMSKWPDVKSLFCSSVFFYLITSSPFWFKTKTPNLTFSPQLLLLSFPLSLLITYWNSNYHLILHARLLRMEWRRKCIWDEGESMGGRSRIGKTENMNFSFFCYLPKSLMSWMLLEKALY
jgi:hypothetical protein